MVCATCLVCFHYKLLPQIHFSDFPPRNQQSGECFVDSSLDTNPPAKEVYASQLLITRKPACSPFFLIRLGFPGPFQPSGFGY